MAKVIFRLLLQQDNLLSKVRHKRQHPKPNNHLERKGCIFCVRESFHNSEDYQNIRIQEVH